MNARKFSIRSSFPFLVSADDYENTMLRERIIVSTSDANSCFSFSESGSLRICFPQTSHVPEARITHGFRIQLG